MRALDHHNPFLPRASRTMPWFVLAWACLVAGVAWSASPEDSQPENVQAEEKEDQVKARAIIALDGPSLGKIKSLFFSQTEITDVRLAINTYLKHANNRDDLTFDEEAFWRRISGQKKASKVSSRYYTYPQFFLDSLVYHGDNDWIIWVNGQKVTHASKKTNDGLQVLNIDPDKVKLQWSPVDMDKVISVWEKLPNDNVEVNALHKKVVFTLHPNQTFSSYVMNVLEGKVLPVTVDAAQISVPAPEPEPAPEPVIPGVDAPPPASKDSNEGLSGLIRSYQKIGKEREQ